MKVHIQRTYLENTDPDQVVEDILKDRNIKNVEDFLRPPHPMDIPFSALFTGKSKEKFSKDWAKTINLLKKIHESGKTIVVYTDYDADGVTGGAIMWETLHKLGFKAMPYIPDRSEGYGFSKKGIDRVISEYDPALIISVDHGIVAHDEIKYASDKGIPIIVTDHHNKQSGEPEAAFAIFHTDQLSGSGVAYFFTKELINDIGKSARARGAKHLEHMAKSDYLGLAAIGTVADLVPLLGYSRSVARYGLAALGTTSRLGLRNLISNAAINPPITAYNVGFMIAPRINAFGRLEHAIDALRLLCTSSYEKAAQLSAQANAINSQRQKVVKSAVEEASKMVGAAKKQSGKIIILDSDTWEEGIIGLIAGKILQEQYKPTIIMTRSDGHAKASVRSVDDVHITEFLQGLEHHFVDMGGHAAAAGFTIKTENIDNFIKDAHEKAAKEISEDMLIRKQHIDIEMPYTMATLPLAEKIAELGPFGMGFKQPVFRSKAIVTNLRAMGKSDQHAKIEVGSGMQTLELVDFNAEPGIFSLSHGDEIDVQYLLNINDWNGRRTPQGVVKRIAVL